MAQIQAISQENGNEISFHSWANEGASNGTDLTTTEIRDYASKAIADIKQAGIRWFPWRAAWLGNSEPNYTANPTLLDDMFYAVATADSDAGVTTSPPLLLKDVPRVGLHSRTRDELELYFTELTRLNSLAIHYTHYISDDFDVNMDVEKWRLYLRLLDENIAAGNLEVVTMETIFRRNGGRFVNAAGSQYWEYNDVEGNAIKVQA